MSFFEGLFGRRTQESAAPSSHTPPHEAWAEKADNLLSDLAAFSRQAGRDVEPATYSELRRIEDLVRPAIADARQHPLLPEREYAIEALLTRLVPETVEAFRRVPTSQRGPGSGASASLRTQVRMLARSAADISEQVQRDAESALTANLLFLEARLSQ